LSTKCSNDHHSVFMVSPVNMFDPASHEIHRVVRIANLVK